MITDTTGACRDLTIVIVNWNGGQLLMRCLESIRAHAGSSGVTVIVVDNDSTDGSREAAAQVFPEFLVMNSGANLGFGRANNIARSLITTSRVLFLNPDTEIGEGTLDRAMQCLDQHANVGAVGCQMVYPDGEVQEQGLQWPMTPWTAFCELLLTNRSRRYFRGWLPWLNPHLSGYVRKLYGGFLLVRRDVLDASGWFDERYFMYAEDADLSRTILILGWKLWYCAEAVIIHMAGGVTEGAPRPFSVLMKQESINKLIRKYEGSLAAHLHRFIVLVVGLLRLSVVLFTGLVALARRSDIAAARWKASCLKQCQLVLWALGLRKAVVPGSVSAGRPLTSHV